MSFNAERIAQAARGWVGTRFHHQGRLKRTAAHKGGVDCLGLLVGVATELDLRRADGTPLMRYDATDYSHLPDCARLRAQLDELLVSIPHESIKSGDILLLAVDGRPQHLGIVTDMGGQVAIIHAYAPARAVVEHVLDDFWRSRIEAAFRFQ